MIHWRGFPADKVDDVWGLALPQLRRGFESPEQADLHYDKIKSGMAQLWCVFDDETLIASLLTELPTIGGRKVCNIISAGGSRLKEWVQFIAVIEAWARENQCVAMRLTGIRKGWARVLTEYFTTRITLEKAL